MFRKAHFQIVLILRGKESEDIKMKWSKHLTFKKKKKFSVLLLISLKEYIVIAFQTSFAYQTCILKDVPVLVIEWHEAIYYYFFANFV